MINNLKQLGSNTPILSYFDHENKHNSLDRCISIWFRVCNFERGGLPIEFASVSLTATQQKCNHIEKEFLALVFECERFHYYLYGKRFKIETDHLPLFGLLKKL